MRTPPLLADFSHARACKPFCENSLTLPKDGLPHIEIDEYMKHRLQAKLVEAIVVKE